MLKRWRRVSRGLAREFRNMRVKLAEGIEPESDKIRDIRVSGLLVSEPHQLACHVVEVERHSIPGAQHDR